MTRDIVFFLGLVPISQPFQGSSKHKAIPILSHSHTLPQPTQTTLTMAKEKKEKKAKETTEEQEVETKAPKTEAVEVDYETRCQAVNGIAHPLASKKLTKKLLKTIKKGLYSTQVLIFLGTLRGW